MSACLPLWVSLKNFEFIVRQEDKRNGESEFSLKKRKIFSLPSTEFHSQTSSRRRFSCRQQPRLNRLPEVVAGIRIRGRLAVFLFFPAFVSARRASFSSLLALLLLIFL